MPPPESHTELKAEDRELLRQWIAQGAKYDTHWAFKPILKPELPAKAAKDPWVKQEIDAFVLDKLRTAHLEPAESAPRERWLKRVTMDLTGLPPTLADMDAFLKDKTEEAYVKVAERLMASPQFGERMANDWLDVARYADTFGRHEDADSENFPYRDWAIRVFNQNLSYDKFIEWQIGGDMLPDATVDMQLATTFQRLHPQSNESGSDEDEFRIDQVNDRVKTTGTALLGMTMECARCHDHKYDPITMKDFYSFSAFLNNIDEQGLFSRFTNATPTPAMFLYNEDQEATHQKLKVSIATNLKALQDLKPAARERFQKWLADGGTPAAAKPTDHLAFEGKWKAADGNLENSADPNPARRASFKFKAVTTQGPVGQALFLKGDVKLSWQNEEIKEPERKAKVADFHRSDPFSIGLWLKMDEVQKRAVIFHHTVGSVDAASRGYEFLVDEMRPDFCLAHFWREMGSAFGPRSKSPLANGCIYWWSMMALARLPECTFIKTAWKWPAMLLATT